MKNLRRGPVRIIGCRMDQPEVTEMLLKAEKLEVPLSEVIKRRLFLGKQEEERLSTQSSKKQQSTKKKDPIIVNALNDLNTNEAVLMLLHQMHGNATFTRNELLKLGFKFGCQVSEAVIKKQRVIGFQKREEYKLSTRWMYHYGIQEMEDDMVVILKRD